MAAIMADRASLEHHPSPRCQAPGARCQMPDAGKGVDKPTALHGWTHTASYPLASDSRFAEPGSPSLHG
ncbi:uncharacterized protein UV8b_00552 [Ustilaginoidea virens]|uniref:Uncharacterized protein n=1 Tax=Ustilaginoidea virens TaxID=1159556 RepID=A0A8E5MEF8_USTVR|nr:uncharacterized protein UV8b_00552 [Ustilaginoidea virens]QUC16311.1 hypothetical protein UV8b_00552 [Ustilaginoidea virens]